MTNSLTDFWKTHPSNFLRTYSVLFKIGSWDSWKTHPGQLSNMDEFSRNGSRSWPDISNFFPKFLFSWLCLRSISEKFSWMSFPGIGQCHNRWVFQDLPIRVKMTVMISNPEISRISKSYLCHSEWDTRIAAAESIEAIIDQVFTILYGLNRSSKSEALVTESYGSN